MRQLSHVPQAHGSRTPGSPGAFAGKEFMAQLPHSRGAQRRENAPVTRRRLARRCGPACWYLFFALYYCF